MPYEIVNDAEGCDGFAVVKTETGEMVAGGCHSTMAEAEDHLTALNIAEFGNDSRQSYKPTREMMTEAARGLAWRREFGRGGTAVGIARARDISNGVNLSLDTVRRMNSYFARHEVDKQGEGFRPDETGYPSNGRIAWALWGGDPGQTWAANILASERSAMSTDEFTNIETVETVEPAPVRYTAPDVEARRIGGREVEFRNFEVSELRFIDDGEGPQRLQGYAAVFNSESEPLPRRDGGVFVETIAPNAFDRTLRSGREIRAFINHDTNLPIGSTKNGSLLLSTDERGLRVDIELPATSYALDLATNVASGLVHSFSFGFSVPRNGDVWSADGQSRELREIILHEVSPVTGFPAYPETDSAQLRSTDEDEAGQIVDDSVVDVEQSEERTIPVALAARILELNTKR
jgi:HK97 family phage prohead protease